MEKAHNPIYYESAAVNKEELLCVDCGLFSVSLLLVCVSMCVTLYMYMYDVSL